MAKSKLYMGLCAAASTLLLLLCAVGAVSIVILICWWTLNNAIQAMLYWLIAIWLAVIYAHWRQFYNGLKSKTGDSPESPS